jgi:hypothetical protein
MADNSVVLLDALLEERERLRGGSPLRADEAFELFSFEQCLKEYDLSEDEIANGQVGGGNDGGLDGLYCFLNANLVEEDAELLEETFDPTSIRREPELLLVIVQAKTTTSFAETPFDKLSAALKLLLDLSKTDEELEQLFSSLVIERFGIFRKTWQKLATRHPRIRVEVAYASKGDAGSINEKVNIKAEHLVEQITSAIPKATAKIIFLGARELIDLAGQEKSYTLSLSFQENATADNSHIALVSLDDYYAFVADNGVLRKHIFDWNVRDYEGAVEVNQEIAESLGDGAGPTMLASSTRVLISLSSCGSPRCKSRSMRSFARTVQKELRRSGRTYGSACRCSWSQRSTEVGSSTPSSSKICAARSSLTMKRWMRSVMPVKSSLSSSRAVARRLISW